MIEITDVRALRDRIGEEIAVGDWFEVSQARIDQFADATGDHQWIHIDPARAAAESPFKTTIAHGFLTLSLISTLVRDAMKFTGLRLAINYGLNRVRFVSPVPSGARIRQYLQSIGRSRAEGPQSAIPDRLFEMGRYGQKTGAGWYKYDAPGSRNRTPDPLIDQMAEEVAKKRGIARRPVADEEIVARITTALANEGARVLEDGFATRAGDIDIVYVYGFGFPRYRGGPMFYADTIGLPTVLARVNEYRVRFGDYWEVAPLLERLVAEGRGFYSEAGAAKASV